MRSRLTYSKPTTLVLSILVLMAGASPASADEPPQLAFPQDPLLTHFTSSFGDARSGGRGHQGTDLMAPKMTPVYAIADGIVTTVRDGGLAGRWISIEHADGWESWYMHLNNDTPGTDDGAAVWLHTLAPNISEGVAVEAGDQIAWAGDSGNAEPSSPHTHFELHRNGAATDPYPYLREAYERELVARASEIVPAIGALFKSEIGLSPPRLERAPS